MSSPPLRALNANSAASAPRRRRLTTYAPIGTTPSCSLRRSHPVQAKNCPAGKGKLASTSQAHRGAGLDSAGREHVRKWR